jgi:hypothetical protein
MLLVLLGWIALRFSTMRQGGSQIERIVRPSVLETYPCAISRRLKPTYELEDFLRVIQGRSPIEQSTESSILSPYSPPSTPHPPPSTLYTPHTSRPSPPTYDQPRASYPAQPRKTTDLLLHNLAVRWPPLPSYIAVLMVFRSVVAPPNLINTLRHKFAFFC